MHRLDQQPVNINTFETRWCGEECFADKVFKLNVALYNAKFLSFFIVTHRCEVSLFIIIFKKCFFLDKVAHHSLPNL